MAHDLSADRVVLDYDELLYVAKVAVYYGLEAMAECLNNIYDGHYTKLDAEHILDSSKRLAAAIRTTYYLEKGKDRTNVEIVRKEHDEAGL